MGTNETATTQVNGAAPTAQYAAMAVGAETLGGFKKRVDDLLHQLKASQAGPTAIGSHKVDRFAYGQGFHEADDLAAAYEGVISQLEAFSKAFGDQIETLSIGAQVAEKGYEAVDADVKSRLAAIQRRTQKLYEQHPQSQSPAQSPSRSDERDTAPGMGSGQSAGPDAV
ncbi:hypothetical protein [Streptomyces sp. MST-110588]|uniref:hypothetical protein n=1 Tax=Streptomyces sp. MST-110588 TaxID=2833628 RepID=UPI001F5CD336|nr:hypothetical protein [Streptomyces sp. MST-110588]UNO41066.1 hypothetical protein KGS77_17580 [Streptomyces sp. MST-110588]